MFKFVVVLLMFSLQPICAEKYAIEKKYIPVTTFTTKAGLLSNDIQDIAQDNKGFIWLGTQKGLSRFDSTEFINFTKDKTDPNSLAETTIEGITVMPNDDLWLSINEVGVNIFDSTKYKVTNRNNSQSPLFDMPNNNLFGIAKDVNDNVWFSLYGVGIYQWDTKVKKFNKHTLNDENAWLTSKEPFEILVDSKNRLWVCSIDSMVYVYDINTGESKSFNFSSNVNDPLISPIYGFTESANGDIYAGGYSGVFKFNEASEVFDIVIPEETFTQHYKGKHTSVRRLMIDSKNNLWVGTVRSLLLYTQDNLYGVEFYENGNLLKMTDSTIHSIMEGSDGNIWVGTEGLGLIKLAPDWDRFNIYISQDKETIDLRNAFQFQDNIWLGHPSSKIDLMQLKNNELNLISSFTPKLGEISVRIDTIYQDEPGVMWLTSINGINKVDLATYKTQTVSNKLGRKLGSVRLLYRDDDGRFYFNLFSEKTIGYFNEAEMKAHFIENTQENSFMGTVVYTIKKGIDNKMWMASDYGIESLDTKSHIFNVVYKSSNHQVLDDFYFDNDSKRFWMIEDGGLFEMHWEGGYLVKVKGNRYKKILPKINFYKIKRFKNNELLISTVNNGLLKLNVNTLTYTVYTQENGLPSDAIKEILFPQGKPLIVTESGAALFNDTFYEKKRKPPKIVIDSIELGNKKLSVNNINTPVFNYNYGSLRFDVALLSYANASFVEYEHRLIGADTKWINTGNDDKYSFLNLSDGDYTFESKGRNNYGTWSDPVYYSFVIKPPPWKSFWAYVSYVLTAIILFAWLLWLYKRKILYELEISKQQTKREIANTASKAKSEFLARVSHEVRTPLNGVLGMGELMLDTRLDEEQKIYAESIMSSGSHLLDIINDILDLSKIEAGKLELEHQSFDLLMLVDEVVGSFASQAKQKRLLFIMNFNHRVVLTRIGDVIRIKQILFNLLSNAFKFTSKGKIVLKVTSSEIHENNVIFSVEDSGIGINKELADDLFKPFVQADSTITRKFGGTGLGLAIVKQLVEKMQGSIEVKNKTTKGSIFTAEIFLPIDTNANILESTDKQNKELCLLIKEQDLQQSMLEFCQSLSVNSTFKVSDKTNGVLVDVFSPLTQEQETQLQLCDDKVFICFIGFDINFLEQNKVKYPNNVSLIPPPITFRSMQKMSSSESSKTDQRTPLVPAIVSQREIRLLLVEDNIINQQVGIEMLEKMGHQVDIVDNAEEALVMLRRNRYDLLIIDYHLPGMDGLNLIKNWENSRNIPAMVVTADLTDEVFQKCLDMGIDNIVAKPFTQLQLYEAIKKAF